MIQIFFGIGMAFVIAGCSFAVAASMSWWSVEIVEKSGIVYYRQVNDLGFERLIPRRNK